MWHAGYANSSKLLTNYDVFLSETYEIWQQL